MYKQSYRTDQRVRLGDEPVRIEVLAERVRQAMLTQAEKKIFMRGDGGVTLQDIMTVMDELKKGGIEDVGLVAAPPER